MKVSFITIHVGYNFGSVLQTIATARVLRDIGVDPICVNYIPPRVTGRRYWMEGRTSILRFIRRVLYFPVHCFSNYKYSRFLSRHCPMSNPIYDEDDFAVLCPKADVYLSGSDQIWNYNHNEGIDRHYFFDGITGKKVSFASSIGMTELPQDYMNYMSRVLKAYSSISVRENSAVNLLAKMGFQSEQLIDPTLVVDKRTWPNYASKRLCPEEYIFVYLPYNVTNKNIVYSTARRIAQKKNLKVVSFSWDYRKEKLADKSIVFADPGDILSLFLYADYVITNSFHGTAFSINLNKQFWVYMPSHYSTRLLSLLELCGLKERLLDGAIGEETVNTSVDFMRANRVLQIEREKAKSFLIKALL